MHGALLFLAEVAIPSAWQCLVFAAPLLVVAALWWLIERADQTVNHLFPEWEWEKRLGWLNLQAHRRADLVLRWLGYVVYAVLAVALYGIVWAAPVLGNLQQWDDPALMAKGAAQVSVLFICLGLWLVYLGLELIPKLRDQYEREELEKFRAEQEEIEREEERNPASRVKSPQPKPRLNSPTRSDWTRPRR